MGKDLNEETVAEAMVVMQEVALEYCGKCKAPITFEQSSVYIPAGPDQDFGKCYHSICHQPESYSSIAQEREACAAIADYHAVSGLEGEIWIATKIAERIRARGK